MFTILAAMAISCGTLSAVDGDTIKCDGVRMRLLGDGVPFKTGIDTAEVRGAKCPAEQEMADRATHRLRELIRTPGLVVENSGAVDRYSRPLVRLRMPNGKTAESVLLAEGLAKVWHAGQKIDWCAAE